MIPSEAGRVVIKTADKSRQNRITGIITGVFIFLGFVLLWNKNILSGHFYLRMFVAWVVVLFIPGFLVIKLLFKDRFQLLELLPLSFASSIACMVIPGVLGYLLRLKMDFLVLFLLLCCSALLFAYFKNSSLNEPDTGNSKSIPIAMTVIVVLIAIIFSSLVFGLGWYSIGDSMYHLSFIRKLAENILISPYNAQFPVKSIDPSYGYSVWYIVLAVIARLSDLDTITIWHYLSGLLTFFAILGVFLFGRKLFKDDRLAFLSVITFVAHYGLYQRMGELKVLVYPNRVPLFIILPAALFFTLDYFQKGRPGSLIFSSFLGVTAMTVHMNGWVIFLLSTGSFWIFTLMDRQYRENSIRLLRVVLATILASVPYLFLKMFITERKAMPGFWVGSDAVKVTDNLFIVTMEILSQPQYKLTFIIASILALYIIFRKKREGYWGLFLMSNVIVPPFIMFNPVLAPLAARIISYTYLHRLFRMLPTVYVYAAGIYAVVYVIEKYFRDNYFVKRMVLAVVVVLLTVRISARYNFLSTRLDYKNDIPEFSGILKENIRDGSVVCSDIWTSSFVPVLSNNYVLVFQRKHMSAVIDFARNYRETKRIYDPDSDIYEVLNYISKYKIDYLLINNNEHPTPNYESVSWFRNDVSFKYDYLPEVFKKVYDNKGYVIYECMKQIDESKKEDRIEKNWKKYYNKAVALHKKNRLREALEKLRVARCFNPENPELRGLNETIRLKLVKKNDRYGDINLFLNGTTVEESSRFMVFPYEADALLDLKRGLAITAAKDFPNWLILDFHQLRTIHSVEIEWREQHRRGESWTISYYDGKKWKELDGVEGWEGTAVEDKEPTIYNYLLANSVRATKVKLNILKSMDKRSRINRFSIDYLKGG